MGSLGSSIGGKILIRSIAVALVPLIILATVVLIGLNQLNSNAEARVNESRALLESESVLVTSVDQASSLAQEINLTLLERVADVTVWSRNGDIINGAFEAGLWSRDNGLVGTPIAELEDQFADTKTTGRAPNGQNYLRREVEANPRFTEIFFTDKYGYNAAYTNETSDFVQSDEEWWTTARDNGIAVEDVEFDDSSGAYTVTIAARIDDERTGSMLGVMKATLDIRFVEDIVQNRPDGVRYSVMMNDGLLIAETNGDQSRLLNPDVALTEAQLAAINSTEADGLITEDVVAGYAPTVNPEAGDTFAIEGFTGLPWSVVAETDAESAFAPIRGLEDLSDDINNSGSSLTTTTFLVLIAALILAAVMARFMSKAITDPLEKLTLAASTAAEEDLPNAVSAINADGADIEAIKIDPVEISTGDELEELARSFNSVQSTAVRLAARQAVGRRNTAEMFVNLGRRNQSLLKRQLRFIDELEQNEVDPDTLESLFRLDHLATRMRRNAESLLVLAGDRSPRRWAAPVPVRDGVQAALAEVESYERVDIAGVEDGEVQGNVVADVAHILAELVENALNFSPPQSEVKVTGWSTASGYTINVIDEGLGMSADDLAEANERLTTVHEISEVPSQYLGLFVVGRLANRHGIKVNLGAASTGGLVATVQLPLDLTQTQQSDDSDVELDPTLDPELAEAEAEAKALLAQAEEALAKVEEAKKTANEDDLDDDRGFTRRSSDRIASAKAGTDMSAVKAKVDQAKAESSSATETSAPESSSTDSMDEETESSVATRPAADAYEDPPATDVTEETVDLGDFAFTRRAGTKSGDNGQQRRADDPAADLDQFGFTRREKKDTKASPVSEPTKSNEGPESEEDAMVTAEGSRNRWSQFQRGKEDAQSLEDSDS